MNLAGAFFSESYDEVVAVAEVTAQAEAWIAAEPNVIRGEVVRVWRPYPDRPRWYHAEMELTFRERVEQTTLGLDVAA